MISYGKISEGERTNGVNVGKGTGSGKGSKHRGKIQIKGVVTSQAGTVFSFVLNGCWKTSVGTPGIDTSPKGFRIVLYFLGSISHVASIVLPHQKFAMLATCGENGIGMFIW